MSSFIMMYIKAFLLFFVTGLLLHLSTRLIKKIKRKALKNKAYGDSDKFYFRDIPFDNLGEAFWVGSKTGLVNNPTDFIGAMILKWIMEDKIDVIKINDKPALDLNKIFKTSIGYETDVYIFLLSATGPNRILENEEIQHLFLLQQKNIFEILEKFEKSCAAELINKKLLLKKDDGTYEFSSELKQKANNLNGLRNFIEDFSLLEDKSIKDIVLWEQYLIYAQLFGIPDKISDTFKEIYPDFHDTIDSLAMKSILITSLKAPLLAMVGLSSLDNDDDVF